jgi:2,5-diketo-D-gluconate reductase A
MKKSTQTIRTTRREFLKLSAALSASVMISPLWAGDVSFGSQSALTGSDIPTVKLNNGVQMPILGFGTNTLRGDIGVRSVAEAIPLGYRLIDTATIYVNEQAVGEGIKRSGIDRKELFITSKLWVSDSGYDNTKKAFQTSLDKLQTDYLDLYLIHRPRGDIKGTWEAMEELHREGKIRAIGLSNFEPWQINELMDYAKINPAVNQIETHAFFHQYKAHEALAEVNIQHEAWSPLVEGRNDIFNNPTLAAIGKKYGKNNAQVSLRWHYQRGIVAIPRSANKAHMAENLAIFDFELSDEDVKTITKLDLNRTQFPEWK